MKRIGCHAGDSTRGDIRKYLYMDPGTDHILRIRDVIKGHHGLIWIAVVDQGLGGVGCARAGQQKQRDHRAIGPPRVPKERAERPFPVSPNAEIGHRPNPGQRRQPGQTHIGHRAKDPEVGKIVRQCPHTGIEPAKLPVIFPNRQAERRKGGKQDQSQVSPAGKLIGGSGCQDRQRQRQTHEKPVGQSIIDAVQNRANHPLADWKPNQCREAPCQHRSGQQRQQMHARHGQRGNCGIQQRIRTAAADTVQLKYGQNTKQDAAHDATGYGGIGQILGQHCGRRRRLVEHQAGHRRQDGRQDNEPGQTALQQPHKLQRKKPQGFHGVTSPGSRESK